MSAYEKIKIGLEQAIAYEQEALAAKTKIMTSATPTSNAKVSDDEEFNQ
ncbi:MAG: hypothetical protein NC081_06860 [Roseburia sp.]|nr:hypothetical protein [Roseburia sp.]